MLTRLIAAVVPYLVWIALAAGLAAGAAGAWYVQGLRLGHAELRIERLISDAAIAKSRAENDARNAENTIAGLSSDLAHSRRQRETRTVEVIREIQTVASPTRQCLAAGTVGVLQRAHPDAEGQDTREPAGSRAAPAADPGRPASELAVSLWITAALAQYTDLRDRHRALSAAVRALPCVDVQ